MANEQAISPMTRIEDMILLLRGQRVMLDSDLAELYGVTTTRLNEQVRRNLERFPADFAFQLTRQEFADLISQIATSKTGRGGRRKLPWAFTEHGALMLASVLNSQTAVEASIRVVRAFVWMREQLMANKELAARLSELESRVGEHDGALQDLFTVIRELIEGPTQEHREISGFRMREGAPRYQAGGIRSN